MPIARELARYGIRCNTIAPGVILTPMTGVLSEKTLEGLKKSAVFPKRLGKPEEFASVACEILRNLYINGTTIYLKRVCTRCGKISHMLHSVRWSRRFKIWFAKGKKSR